jgi:hypothetical protein
VAGTAVVEAEAGAGVAIDPDAGGVAGAGAGAAGVVAVVGAEFVSLGTPGSAWEETRRPAANNAPAVNTIGEKLFRLGMVLKVKAFLRF